MNTIKIPTPIYVGFSFFILIIISETTMAFFFNKALDTDEFLNLLNELPQGSTSDRQIKGTTLENQELPDQTLENIHFKSCKWLDLDAHEKILKNIIFEDCDFNNVNMRNAELSNVQLINSKLTNVVMNEAKLEQVKFKKSKLISTDPNIDHGHNGIQADEILYEDCELTNIGFYKAKGIFRFVKSTLYDIAGQSLLVGSSLYLHDSKASVINFDRSKLTNLEVLNSTIDKRSSVGGGSIKNIRVENSKLEFSLGDNSNIESAVFENSGDVVVGGGANAEKVVVKNCPRDTYWLDVGGENFGAIEIENCHVTDLSFSSSSGKIISIKNSSMNVLDFRKSNIEKLILDNVTVRGEIEYTKTQLGKLEQNNLSFGKNIDIYREGSNMEIKPDKILEE